MVHAGWRSARAEIERDVRRSGRRSSREGEPVDIGKCFKDAWGLFRLDWAPLVVTALIAAVIVEAVGIVMGLAVGGGIGILRLISFTELAWGAPLFGTLVMFVVLVLAAAWMYAVTFRMLLRRVRERRPAEFADLQSFDQISSFAVAAVVLGVIVGIGYMALVVPGLILTTVWLYALPLVGDRRLTVGEAMSQSKDMAAVPGYMATFVTWLVGAIVVGVVVGILYVIPLIGAIVGLAATPFGVAYVVSMYFQSRGEGHLIDEAVRR